MQNLYVMVGVSGSGKSTYCHYLFRDTTIISTDKIRGELWGDEGDQQQQNVVWNEAYSRIRAALAKGEDCVLDATNLSIKNRRRIFNEVKGFNVRVTAIVVLTPIGKCLTNQYLRERRVPDEVVMRQLALFQIPTIQEGFDEVKYYVNPIYANKSFFMPFHRIVGYDQKNPHHTLTLDKHLERAENYAISKRFNNLVSRAAAFHDIGKFYCQTIGNDGVAHYYGHSNISAYLYLLYTMVNEGDIYPDNLYIALLIQHHMDFFRNNLTWQEGLMSKYGNKWFWDLCCLHECDLEAH